MTKRIPQLFVTFAALTALALGGAVFANAKTSHSAKHERTAAVDTDNIQSGDQTTPDASKKDKHADKRAAADLAGGGTGQSGNQSGNQNAPDTGAEGENAGETPSESGPSDGPGGHADPAGATVDHQFQGVE